MFDQALEETRRKVQRKLIPLDVRTILISSIVCTSHLVAFGLGIIIHIK